jgi:hypothetical protein
MYIGQGTPLRFFLDIRALCPEGGSLPYAEILFRMDKDTMTQNKRGHMKIVKLNNLVQLANFPSLHLFSYHGS